MNIIKRIGSFASNSWKDFSDYYEQQQSGEPPSPPIQDDDISEAKEGSSFEVNNKKQVKSEEVIQKKTISGMIRKRFSKKKLLLDDPRSPTNEFQRTPIQLCKTLEAKNEILSPFNLQDMFATIDSLVETPKMATPSKELKPSNEQKETVAPIEKNENIIDNTCDWHDYKFSEKIMSESMIVEVSTTFDLSQTEEEEEEKSTVVDTISSANQSTEQLIPVEENVSNNQCKTVGCVVKNDNSENIKCTDEKVDKYVTSTPKKGKIMGKLNCEKSVQRTPLSSIGNSPLVKMNVLNNKFQMSKKAAPVKSGKKKLANTRQLPKAPSTPMTPLFKSKAKCVAHFDKENF